MDDHQYVAVQTLALSNDSYSTSFVRVGTNLSVRISTFQGNLYRSREVGTSGAVDTLLYPITNYPGTTWSDSILTRTFTIQTAISPVGQATVYSGNVGMDVSGDPAKGTNVTVTCTVRMTYNIINASSRTYDMAFSVLAQ